MSVAVTKNFKLVILGTDWTLTQFRGSKSCKITSYKTGHCFQGEKEAKEKGTRRCKLGELGTGWALTQLGTCGPSEVTTYETGHLLRGGKAVERIQWEIPEAVAEFFEVEKRKVSRQGWVSLEFLTRALVRWLESEEVALEEVGIMDAVRYMAWLGERIGDDGKPYAVGTIHNHLKAARRLFTYLVNTERRKTNPFLEVDYPRQGAHLSRNVLTEAQMGRLLAELALFDTLPTARRQHRRYRVHVLAEFLYATGLRIEEACSLRADQLDLDGRLIYLPSGKGGKPRTVFLTGYAAGVMRLYVDQGREAILRMGQSDESLFGAGKTRVAQMANQELHEVCTALELPVITCHGFRYSLGTHLLRSGCDMRHIQVILGHEALSTTQIYTRVDKEDLRRSLDEHHPRRFNPRAPRGPL